MISQAALVAQLLTNSTKTVNPILEYDELIGEVPIKKYVDFNSPEWSMFSYIESNKAFELYPNCSGFNAEVKITNNTYSIIEPSVQDVVELFIKRLGSMRDVAITEQIEGMAIGEGELIFQSRMMVNLFKQPDGMIKLRWRGKLTRIPKEPAVNDNWVLPTNDNLSAFQKDFNSEILKTFNNTDWSIYF